MNKLEIQKIFNKKLKSKVIRIIDTSKGMDQEVKVVETPGGKFVIKIPHKEKDKIIKQKLAIELCLRKKIPVPTIVFANKDYLIESYLEGEDLDDINLNEKDLGNIYFELGKILKKIHSINGENFGAVYSKKLKGKFKTQKENIESWMNKELIKLENKKYFSMKEFYNIKEYYNKNRYLLNSKKSVMLHSDFAEYNIRVNNKKISGIMDFGDLSVGPPMEDFARIYINNDNNYKFKKLLKGYGKYNLKEIKFYAFCLAVWKINLIQKNKSNKKFKKLEKILIK